jgi:hypothetical protein
MPQKRQKSGPVRNTTLDQESAQAWWHPAQRGTLGKEQLGLLPVGNHPAMTTTVTNARFQQLGYVGFYNYYHWKTG